jgi:hypothetical protein
MGDRERENAAVRALMTLPPLAMLQTGEERWSMVMPIDVEIYGHGTYKVALGEVFESETRSN